MKKLLYLLCFHFCSIVVCYSEPVWIPINYTNSTTAYGIVTIDGVPATNSDKVAAFVGDECRAVGDVIVNFGVAYITLVIQGESVEDVGFKVWDVDKDLICNVDLTVQTSPGNSIGYPPDYLNIDALTKSCPDPFGPTINYTNSTTAYGIVTMNGEAATESDIVAVYVGDECRAKGYPVIFEGQAYITLVVQGESVEELEFRVLDESACEVYENVLRTNSNPGGSIGYPPDYLEIFAFDNVNPAAYTVAFNVTDGVNPVANASIGINGQTLITDVSGVATIDLVNGDHDYTVTAVGYDDAIGMVTVSGANVTENVSLDETSYTVTFNVTNGTDPIVNASIEIDGQTRTSDAAGEATIDLVNGDHDYTVTAVGYDDAIGMVTVSGANVTENVSLVETAYTVTFNVTNGTDPIVNASIEISSQTLTTDAYGKAIIDLVNGEYACTVTADGYEDAFGTVTVSGVSFTENIILSISTIVNIEEERKLSIYPNPVEDELEVELEIAGPYGVQLLDLSGRVLYKEEFDNTTAGIDLSNFDKGIYLIKIQTDGKEYLEKIIKQ